MHRGIQTFSHNRKTRESTRRQVWATQNYFLESLRSFPRDETRKENQKKEEKKKKEERS